MSTVHYLKSEKSKYKLGDFQVTPDKGDFLLFEDSGDLCRITYIEFNGNRFFIEYEFLMNLEPNEYEDVYDIVWQFERIETKSILIMLGILMSLILICTLAFLHFV
jgi:hypothetical protein